MIHKDELVAELTYRTSRSSGPGGQNVNKVESRVTAIWHVEGSQLLSEVEKAIVEQRLAHRINALGMLAVDSSESRSQLENKELVVEKLVNLVNNALRPIKKRIPTKISKAKVLERLDRKKRQANKKKDRKWRLD
ncbi:aminoacyl-tRNA hydrolase [Sphingobacterium alkalisoli]|uniref:Aminoacyl-tRNA hydrolase n=1 Tax=Sphingobacterium alkalisoli TaxID=1874115 RepID=A0A4U0HB52_9SPHI|nr:alternative ribosome rescue aminoacyl-tRNA hydrolase ArfB [Sphingobacterium alkalisoli]TJY68634.1 aminoacyl-tRNA hydrolase [Sphingobacterium alkalisoli]GGH05170.1 aminoacyl-tRNA hydrolase [Sphingobacterium alkalisoli]